MARPARSAGETVDDGTGRHRLSREDWVETATEVLAAQGLYAVAVERIAEQLGVTKGSFYAHFQTRDDLVAAVLERWKTIDNDEVLATLDRIEDPREQLARFLDFGFERHHWGRVFAALCATASDPRVDPVMTEVRKERLAYLERALRDLGLRRQEAHDRATLIYASYVGFWRLAAADPDWEYKDDRPLHRIAEHIKATLIPPPTRHRAATSRRRGPAVAPT
jgi:AcrR family transcriptional regulator